MPPLENPRHEAYCQHLMQGLSADAAYEAAGFKPHRSSASRLRTKANVVARLAELRAEAEGRYKITRERLLEEHAKCGFANMADYMTIDGGTPRLDWSKLDRESAAAIAEITVDMLKEHGDEERALHTERVRFRLHDKKGALDSIARIMGWDKQLHGVDDELGELLRSLGERQPRALTNGHAAPSPGAERPSR